MMQLLRVRESKATLLTLSESQAAALDLLGRKLAAASNSPEDDLATVIRCTRSSSDLFSVFVDNAVGVIAVEELEIVVDPKIPLNHLTFLLERAQVVPRLGTDGVKLSQEHNFLDLVARWFLEALKALFRDDLLHDYREHHDDLTVLRGRLDTTATLKLFHAGVPKLRCIYDEYDADIALNRLLKAAAERLAVSGVFSEALRRRARLMARRFVGVGPLEHDDLRTVTDRRTISYTDAVMLAKLLLSSESVALDFGAVRASAFLLPTPLAVQEGLTRLIREYLMDESSVACGTIPVGHGLRVNPDLVFKSFGVVADIKYKLFDGTWKRPDLYQVVSFAAALKSSRGAICSFVNHRDLLPPRVKFGDISVTSIAWLADDLLAPQAAASAFCDELDVWLRSGTLAVRESLIVGNMIANAT